MRRANGRSTRIDVALFLPFPRNNGRPFTTLECRLVLERCENNKRRACRELGISYHTLDAYLRSRPGREGEVVIDEGPEAAKGEE